MNDYIWFIAIGVLFLLLGFVFVWLGLAIWKKQKMDLIIRHHCDKVNAENKPAFCTLSGVGVFVIGIGFALSGICSFLLQSVLIFIPMSVGLVLGLVLLTLAVFKYNH